MNHESIKKGASHVVFVLLLVLGFLFIIKEPLMSPTGYSVADSLTAQEFLEDALSTSALMSSIPSSSMCVIINDPYSPVSLKAVKTSSGWQVEETTGYCSGRLTEELIVQFPDYDGFSELVSDPSPRNLANAAKQGTYEILPSKFVESGGNVVCDSVFRAKYCSAVKNMANTQDIIEGDLACCLDSMSKEEKKLLEEHLQDPRYTDELGIIEEPGGISIGFILSAAGLFVIILAAVLVALLMLHKGKKHDEHDVLLAGSINKNVDSINTGENTINQSFEQAETTSVPPQIIEYITQAFEQGYLPQDVSTVLIQAGWDAQLIETAINQITNQTKVQ